MHPAFYDAISWFSPMLVAFTTIAPAGRPAMIQSRAFASDLTLITHDIGGFRRIAGLRPEDWT